MDLGLILIKRKFGEPEQELLEIRENLKKGISRKSKESTLYWFGELFKKLKKYNGKYEDFFWKRYNNFGRTVKELAGYQP